MKYFIKAIPKGFSSIKNIVHLADSNKIEDCNI